MSPPPEPSLCVLVIDDAIAGGDIPVLCERLGLLLASNDAEVAVCRVGALAADAVTLDALARLQLTARRLGCRIRLDGATRELDRLITFVGLADVLPGDLGVEQLGQAEQREQPRGVEE